MFGKKNKDAESETTELTKEDIKEMLAHCKVYKDGEPVPKNPWRIESLPEARLRDKYSRDCNFEVMASWFNAADKSITIQYVSNAKADQNDTITIPYEKLCSHFGWDGFDVSENQQLIYPKWA